MVANPSHGYLKGGAQLSAYVDSDDDLLGLPSFGVWRDDGGRGCGHDMILAGKIADRDS